MDGMYARFAETAANGIGGEKFKKTVALNNKLVLYILVICLHIDDVRDDGEFEYVHGVVRRFC